MTHDPWRLGQVGQPARGPRLGNGEQQPVSQQNVRADAGEWRGNLTGVALGEDHIEVARHETRHACLRVDMRNRHRELRIPGGERRNGRRDKGVRGRLERRDPHLARHVGAARRDRRLGALEFDQDRLGVRHQHLGGRGQAHPAPERLGERRPHLALQRRQLVRHRGRAVAEGLRDGGQCAAHLQLAQ
jgi:hypothetical protein